MIPNKELLVKIKEVIQKEPRRLEMASWGNNQSQKGHECGTEACLAGWAVLLQYGDQPEDWDQAFREEGVHYIDALHLATGQANISRRAAELLGIPEADCPFYMTKLGPDGVVDWVDRVLAGENPRQAAIVAGRSAGINSPELYLLAPISQLLNSVEEDFDDSIDEDRV